MTATLPDDIKMSLTVVPEPVFARLIGVHPNTVKSMRRNGTGPPAITLSAGRIGYRITDIQSWLEQLAGESSRLTPEVRAASLCKVVRFIDATSEGDHAQADAIIPVNAANADVIEACGLLIRAVRASGRGAELWAQLREQVTEDAD